MPILPNAKKALRASKRKAEVNARVRSKMKTLVKRFQQSPSDQLLPQVYSAIDRAVKQNVIHKNKAARLKSKLSQLV